MDLVSSIRKSGSRGGVNFSWDDVAGSQHRENYLGHSLKAPVGRWQKGRDLTWYAKSDATGQDPNETEEERAARERREEIKRIKEAEEDAIARALGLPVPTRNQSGANAVEVGKGRVGPEEVKNEEDSGSVVDKVPDEKAESRRRRRLGESEGRHRRRHRSRQRSRSRSRDRRRDRSLGKRDGHDSRRTRGDTRHHRPSPRDLSLDRHRDYARSPRARDDYENRRSRDEPRGDKRRRGYSPDGDEDRHRPSHRRERSRSPRRSRGGGVQ
ncbi:kinase phosphorylation protein-domain-containing protein [Pseudomassariella vexata]|uniref:Kinase phosphorylation protein-domain-containing protein n=1 Tax=Pseudomassariella vexata TaxID=1141098 RepID=A0A1Y2EJU7_9PEZI|nr:kinase phosphorylation protein-domain-containing protein [Pseudomassariella vexata]ORY71566.1 kinase phosphorylation protein-domain-containing protein [Pseudomassariella vexata]